MVGPPNNKKISFLAPPCLPWSAVEASMISSIFKERLRSARTDCVEVWKQRRIEPYWLLSESVRHTDTPQVFAV